MSFPCSADHEQDCQPCPVDPYSAICDDHTYIHTLTYIDRHARTPKPQSIKGHTVSLGGVQYIFGRNLIIEKVSFNLINVSALLLFHEEGISIGP